MSWLLDPSYPIPSNYNFIWIVILITYKIIKFFDWTIQPVYLHTLFTSTSLQVLMVVVFKSRSSKKQWKWLQHFNFFFYTEIYILVHHFMSFLLVGNKTTSKLFPFLIVDAWEGEKAKPPCSGNKEETLTWKRELIHL